jgi:MFS family permease
MQKIKSWLGFLKYDLNKTEFKIISLASMGGMLEFYDFTIYGLFSVYFANQFFPSNDNLISIIASYSVFIIGYIARPIGGILFSHIGDEVGRKIVLVLTLVIMGIASIGIGLLPTYASIGIWAPILLLFFRLVQGLAIGGELPSMIVYVTESMPNKRGYAIGGVLSGTDAGLLLGMIVNFILIYCLNKQQLLDFGWRIPFIFGGLLCFVSYQIRKKLHETKAFTQHAKDKIKFPLAYLLKNHLPQVLIGIGITGIMGAFVMLSIIFMPTYLTQIAKIPAAHVSNLTLIATIVTVIAAYVMGLIANKFNPRRVMSICLVLAVFVAIISYNLIAANMYLLLALCMLTLMQGFFATLSPLLISYIFPTRIRLTGVALSYNLGHTIFGGLAPILVTGLIHKTHFTYMVPVAYISVVVAITLIAVYYQKIEKD